MAFHFLGVKKPCKTDFVISEPFSEVLSYRREVLGIEFFERREDDLKSFLIIGAIWSEVELRTILYE